MSRQAASLNDAWLTRAERASFEERPMFVALAIFIVEFAGVLAFTALAVAPLPLAVNLAAGWVAGVLIGTLFTVGHDATHDAFTANHTVNKWIARLSFVPSAHSMSLWELGHHRAHHAFNNLRKRDYVWEPMTPEEYRAATPFRRWFYRLCRGPFGSTPYYLVHMWWSRHFLPIAPAARREWKKHIFDTAFVTIGWLGFGAACTWIGSVLSPGRPLWVSCLLGWVVPFLVFNWAHGWIIYLHHTHPDVPWFDDPLEWSNAGAAINCTVNVRLFQPIDAVSNNIMDHNAHHAATTIPLYRLRDAQEQLRRTFPQVHFVHLTPRSYLRVTSACKLYDSTLHRWTDYDGNPTGPVCWPAPVSSRDDRA